MSILIRRSIPRPLPRAGAISRAHQVPRHPRMPAGRRPRQAAWSRTRQATPAQRQPGSHRSLASTPCGSSPPLPLILRRPPPWVEPTPTSGRRLGTSRSCRWACLQDHLPRVARRIRRTVGRRTRMYPTTSSPSRTRRGRGSSREAREARRTADHRTPRDPRGPSSSARSPLRTRTTGTLNSPSVGEPPVDTRRRRPLLRSSRSSPPWWSTSRPALKPTVDARPEERLGSRSRRSGPRWGRRRPKNALGYRNKRAYRPLLG
jgi:hypothetical protein